MRLTHEHIEMFQRAKHTTPELAQYLEACLAETVDRLIVATDSTQCAVLQGRAQVYRALVEVMNGDPKSWKA